MQWLWYKDLNRPSQGSTGSAREGDIAIAMSWFSFTINYNPILQKLAKKVRSPIAKKWNETSKYVAQNTCIPILFAYISDAEQVTGEIIIGNNLMFKMCSACQCPSFLNLVKRKNTKIWTIETDPLCYVRKRQENTSKEVENFTKCQFYSETIHFQKRLLLCKNEITQKKVS